MLDFLCIIMGYLVGSINPAYIISKHKNINLKELGSGNLGTTNATMVLGKKSGLIVFIVDFFKGFSSYVIPYFLLKRKKTICLLVGACAIIGHIYPFYLDFKGGKGLLTFIGVIFGYDPSLCFSLLIISALITALVNYSVAMPFSLTFLFFTTIMLTTKNTLLTLIALLIALIIQIKHFSNFKDAKEKKDLQVRDYFNKFVFKDTKFLDNEKDDNNK